MECLKIKVPDKIRDFYEEDYICYKNEFVKEINRSAELEFFYKHTTQAFVEQVFLLFEDKGSFIKDYNVLMEEAYRISLLFIADIDFSVMNHKTLEELTEDEKEMYFTVEGHRNTASVLFCSWLYLPFFEKGQKVSNKNYNKFWSYFRKRNVVNVENKIEKIVQGRFLASGNDRRFWEIAELYGETKNQWFIKTINLLTTTSMLKIEIGRNVAIYFQVIAKDSLTFLTRRNFKIPLTLQNSSKVIQENPDNFIGGMILEEELLGYISANPAASEIVVNNKLPRHLRLLSLVIMDKLFDISAEIFISSSKDNYYVKLIKQVITHFLTENQLYVLSMLIKENLETGEKVGGRTQKIKLGADELTEKYFNIFAKNITDNVPPTLIKNVRLELNALYSILQSRV